MPLRKKTIRSFFLSRSPFTRPSAGHGFDAALGFAAASARRRAPTAGCSRLWSRRRAPHLPVPACSIARLPVARPHATRRRPRSPDGRRPSPRCLPDAGRRRPMPADDPRRRPTLPQAAQSHPCPTPPHAARRYYDSFATAPAGMKGEAECSCSCVDACVAPRMLQQIDFWRAN
jgi:hypothetical protein|uniref:Uncharacterized protein n=1 Tax=Oryza sativa subsp. japonica TaxID=39947 RepID=Q6H811_ORYSJ|nr:hypothetical protein [Oryza sativa Japonica Group]